METLNSAFRGTVARWWNGHKKNIHSWADCQKFLRLRFTAPPQEFRSRFNGQTSPQLHLEQCYEAWTKVSQEEWVHRFIHTLEHVAKNWYAEVELRHGTVSWHSLADSFFLTFSINDVCPALDKAIRLIHSKVFDDKEVAEYQPDWKEQEANVVECYNLAIDEEDDPRNVNIPESEGHCKVHGPEIELPEVTQPLKTRKVTKCRKS